MKYNIAPKNMNQQNQNDVIPATLELHQLADVLRDAKPIETFESLPQMPTLSPVSVKLNEWPII